MGQGRLLLSKLTDGKVIKFNRHKFDVLNDVNWKTLRRRFGSLLEAVFDQLGGDEHKASLLLEMLYDSHPIRALISRNQAVHDRKLKDIIICALEEFFNEFIATKGSRKKEMQHAVDIVLAALISEDVHTAHVRTAFCELFNLQRGCLKKALERWKSLMVACSGSIWWGTWGEWLPRAVAYCMEVCRDTLGPL